MEGHIRIIKDDVSIFDCPKKIRLDHIFDYFIFNQNDLLVCSITAAISLIEYLRQKEGKKCEKFSVGFLYHNAILENRDIKMAKTVGLKATSVLNAILKHGICTNDKWHNLNPFIKPTNESVIDALSRIKHANIEKIDPSIETIRYIIGFCQRPIVAILNLYDKRSFSNLETSYNIIHCPEPNQNIEDRHSILLVGYDDDEKVIYFQNSYGKEWGLNGFGRISYDYIPYFGILYSMDESCIKSDEIF